MYSGLVALVGSFSPQASDSSFAMAVSECLLDIWLNDYGRKYPLKDVVETKDSGFSYLFDIEPGRLIAAWGISQGRHGGARDKSRMAGHPLSAGSDYHRGHAVPHTLGGGLDINLVPQLGKVNIGAFRRLERAAVRQPGSVYFTYWSYSNQVTQTPKRVDQGLLVRGQMADISPHWN